MSPTVLITGAGGNIGTKLRAHFTTLGWTLRLLDIDARGDVAIQVADLTEANGDWVRQFAGVDTVIHLAGDPSPRASWASVQRLNIDLTANVYDAAVAQGVRRVVFASSNWTMAGHRPGRGPLTTDMAPYPINPYGVSKLLGERMARSVHASRGLSVICFRIGWVQRADNLPGPHMGAGDWGQAMWLSDRDVCHAMERAVLADNIGFAVLNLMSDNPGMRWDIEPTKRMIGYAPRDGARPVLTDAGAQGESHAHELRRSIEQLEVESMQRW
jgi:NAD+ dependent glucose-6-phosphate dehydrogenase